MVNITPADDIIAILGITRHGISLTFVVHQILDTYLKTTTGRMMKKVFYNIYIYLQL